MKYTKDQLQQMATEALQARNTGDQRYSHLVMVMQMFTGLNQQQVEKNIQKLANGERVS